MRALIVVLLLASGCFDIDSLVGPGDAAVGDAAVGDAAVGDATVGFDLAATDLRSPCVGPSLLTNPGFESGVMPWVGFNSTPALDASEHHSGTASVHVCNTGNALWSVYQLDPFPTGGTVTFCATAWVKSSQEAVKLQFSGHDSGDNVISGTVSSGVPSDPTNPDWQMLQHTHAVSDSGGVETIVVEVISTQNTSTPLCFNVDDAVLTAAP